MSLRERTRPGLGIIEPCLHEIKSMTASESWRHAIKTLNDAAHDGDQRPVLEWRNPTSSSRKLPLNCPLAASRRRGPLFWDFLLRHPTTVYIYQTPFAVFPFRLKARLLQLGAVF
jgi:hypothetical protein